jgi:hypothetical protein
MSTGPQIYPGANHTSYWFQDEYGGDAMEVNTVVWHSTEGPSITSYSGGSMAPNLTVVPDLKSKKLVWYQHFNIDTSSRALVNLTGGVQTNTLNVVQVEFVGTCDPRTHERWTREGIAHLYTPELPDWAIDGLADFCRWMHDNHGVPLTDQVTFKAYPDSYGSSNGVRMSFAKWEAYRGHCGHMHVPENLHGDPGAFPMDKILSRAAQGAAKPPAKPTEPTGAVKPKVSLRRLIEAARKDPTAAQGHTTHPADVKPVEGALYKLGLIPAKYAKDGSFGSVTIVGYARWQKKYSRDHNLGWSGDDVNGIPGETSLKALAIKTGMFQVVA